MDAVVFVQNIKNFCARKNIKPTVACRESGAGKDLINQIERQRSMPSVEKVQLLAQYLGVTVSELLGETSNLTALLDLSTGPPQAVSNPDTMLLRDSAVVVKPSDFTRLTVDEVKMVMAYRRASPEIRRIIDSALEPYKEKETTSAG